MTQDNRQANLELDLQINKDFEENSPYQEGIISEINQRSDSPRKELSMGHDKNRLERSLCDFEWYNNKNAKFS